MAIGPKRGRGAKEDLQRAVGFTAAVFALTPPCLAQWRVYATPSTLRVTRQEEPLGSGQWRFWVERDDLRYPRVPGINETWSIVIHAEWNDSITLIDVPTGEGTVRVSVGRGSGQPHQWASSVGGIVERAGSQGQLWVEEIDARDAITAFTADRIGRLNAPTITGPIVSRTSIDHLNAKGGTITGPIRAEQGDIRTISAFSALRADADPHSPDVSALNGSINSILGGNVGAAGNPAWIAFRGGPNAPGQPNSRLQDFVGWTVHARIESAEASDPAEAAQVYRFITHSGFTGSLRIGAQVTPNAGAQLTEPIFRIGGDLDADVTFVNNAPGRIDIGGEFKPGRTFRLGTSLGCAGPAEPLDVNTPGGCPGTPMPSCNGYDARFTIGAEQGLKGLVIVGNRAELGTQLPAGQWHERLFVGTGGPSPLTVGGDRCFNNAEYLWTSADLGGGSVGVVPFRIHPLDSYPPRGTNFAAGAVPADPEFLVRFYGPVYWDSALTEARPVRLERRPIGDDIWRDTYPCDVFEYALSPDGLTVIMSDSLGEPGNVQLALGYEYRIVPRTGPTPGTLHPDALRCDIEALNAPAVAEQEAVWFSVGLACHSRDVDGSGQVGVDDLALVIAEWGSAGCHLQADADRDGNVGLDDLSLIIDQWGAGCAEPLAQAGPAQRPGLNPDEASALLGFDGIAGFLRAIASMPPTEQLHEVRELTEVMAGAEQ